MAQTNTCTDPSLINVSMPWERMQNALAHAVGRTAESQYSHLRDVRDEIRMTAFAFSHLNPPAAERYLSSLYPDAAGYHEMQDILRAPGTLITMNAADVSNWGRDL
jgi:hypothetical protein